MKKDKKEVYQLIDIIGKEMAKQYFNVNINLSKGLKNIIPMRKQLDKISHLPPVPP